MDKIALIFDNIIVEAALGQIIIGDKTYSMKFNTLNGYKLDGNFDSGVPTLIIKDKNSLISLLEKYMEIIIREKKLSNLSDEDIKCYLTTLWFGATFGDLSNPEEYISRMIKFYMDDDNITDEKDSILIQRKPNDFLTPYKLEILHKNDVTILYGIADGVCYIYKINGINYGNVNMIINLFMVLLKKGITKFKVVSYLPLEATVVTNNKTSDCLSKGVYQSSVADLRCCKESEIETDKIKVFDILKTLSLEGFINIAYDPYELDEYMYFEINKLLKESDAIGEFEEFAR